MIKLITIVSLSVVVTPSSLRIAIANGDAPAKGKAESTFVEIPQNGLKGVNVELSLVPEIVEFEGFIHYGSPIQSTSTNSLGQTVVNVSSAVNAPVDQIALAKRLIIPRIAMREATVQETLAFVKRKSQELDSAKRGVNLVFTDLPESATKLTYTQADLATFGPNTTSINGVTFDLINVSVFDVIQRVAKLGDVQITAGNDAITVHARTKK